MSRQLSVHLDGPRAERRAMMRANRGQFERGFIELEEVVRKYEEDGAPVDDLASMYNIMGVLAGLMGDSTRCRKLLETALRTQRATLGDVNPETLITMENLAFTLLDLGDNQRARQLFQESLKASRERGNRISTIWSMVCLSEIYRSSGDLAEAREIRGDAELAFLRLLEAKEPSDSHVASDLSLYSRLNYGPLLVSMVREECRRLLSEQPRPSSKILTRIQGIASSLGNESLELACDLERIVLDGNRLVLGDQHFTTIESMESLSLTLLCLNEFEEAKEANSLLESVLDAKCRMLGAKHPETLETIDLLAKSLVALGDVGGARRLLTSPAVTAYEESYPGALASLRDLAA